jgi:PAS domain S-box-containing protein
MFMGADTLSILLAVFESTTDGILIVDTEGRVLQSNRRFQEMWKIPDKIMETQNREELLKCILDQLVDPDSFVRKANVLYHDNSAISEEIIHFKDGRIFTRYSRPLISKGTSLGRVYSFDDITEQKKSEEVFSAITNLSPDIITLMSVDGRIIFNSAASEKIHGYRTEELIGKSTFEYIHPDDQGSCSAGLNELLDHPENTVSIQYRYRNKDGNYIWMEATASNQIANPLIKGLVVISRDIRKRKMLEEELSEALRVREEFISIITHELKTPVTSIKLQLQMLLRSGRIIHQDEQGLRSENLPAMINQVNSLERLIDDLLQVSRIKNSKLMYHMHEENLSKLVRAGSERLKGLLTECHCDVRIDIEEGIKTHCDPMRIEQVLVNLLSNVVKYAPGKPVVISLRKINGHAELRLKDHGPGIPVEKQQDIFKLFSRVSDQHVPGGLGVGLYISSRIVDEHKGTLEVESSPGNGSEFILRLPAL